MKNRNALVFGGSKGIGFAISERLALNGANLILNSRNLKNLKEAEKQLRVHNVEISLMVGDLGDENITENVTQHLQEIDAKVDYLIVNSGGPPMGRVDELDNDDWQAAIQQNLLGGIYVVRNLVDYMVKQKFGRIVFISSTAAFEPSPEMILSSTARAGVSSFAKAFGAQYAGDNITCNVICPGGVATQRLNSLIEAAAQRQNRSEKEVKDDILKTIPAGRFAEPSEIAYFVEALCSEEAGYLTGQTITIDGAVTKGF